MNVKLAYISNKKLNYLFFVVPVTLIIIVLILVVVGKLGVYGFGHLSILVLHVGSRS